MNFCVLTLFPDMIQNAMSESIFGRAIKNNILTLDTINIRDYTRDKHKHVDDYPYGGGAGMVMQAEPVYLAYQAALEIINNKKQNTSQETIEGSDNGDSIICQENKSDKKPPRVVYLTPQGKVFDQGMSRELAKEDSIIFLCGHYEGIDERVLELIVTDNVSIGDYVLTGGELPAMVMMDSISRNIEGVLNNQESAEFESFYDNLLEYPQYTRPEEFMEKKVPQVLLSGHHLNIEKYRREQSLIRTLERRPDLLENANLDKKDIAFIEKYKKERLQ